MINAIKSDCRALLEGFTFKLFFISFTSFFIRFGGGAGITLLLYRFFISDFFALLTISHSITLAYTLFILMILIIVPSFLLICTAIKQKEIYCYLLRDEGRDVDVFMLFGFSSLRYVLKAFIFYLKLFLLRTAWLIYFTIPCLLYFFCCFPFLKSNELPYALKIASLACGFFIILISLFIWRIACTRYVPYFSGTTKIKSILINKNDLKTILLLKYSFAGWILSCIFIFPALYVVPYKALCLTSTYKAMPL